METDQPPRPSANRNLVVLFAVSALIGVGAAVYEVGLPLYFRELGMTWTHMGWVYGAAAAVTFAIRVGLGAWSDRAGRKIAYVVALGGAGLATLATPFFRSVLVQGAIRSVADPTIKAREALHSVLLYEDSPSRFRGVFSRTRGVEFAFHVVGLLAAAWFLARMAGVDGANPLRWIFMGAASMLLMSGWLFAFLYAERPAGDGPRPRLAWGDLLRPRLSRPMWILTASNFVFLFGVFISHCFALQLFFTEKYGAEPGDIFVIGALHRVACAIPLLLVGQVFRSHLKRWLMLFLVLEGVFIALPGFLPAGDTLHVLGLALPGLWTAVAVWLVHDLLGMGVWLPLQQELMQRHSRPESRGKDVSLAQSIAATGAILAPFVAGRLREWPGLDPALTVNFPFIFSGLGVMLSALVLIPLPGDGPKDG